MEMGNHGISISEDSNEDISIENRNDDDEEEEEDENVGVGRTYECGFCKRGFTNAQALGGHMNMHRKDKAKANANVKAKASHLPTFSSSFHDPSSCSSDSTISYKPKEASISAFSSTLPPQMGNYREYSYNPFHPNPISRSKLSHPSIDYYRDYFSMIGRSSAVDMDDEHLGSDLSLKINSSSSMTNHQAEEEKKNDDVDLELRLGYD